MYGLMQNTPLLISSLIEHAAACHGMTEVVSRRADGTIERSNWSRVALRARQVANMLGALGLDPGDRVASLAWNRLPHLELYFGAPGAGIVLHTVNPRLHDDQIAYMINHAEDGVVFVDPDLLPQLERLAATLPGVRKIVVLTDRAAMPPSSLPNLLCYEELLAAASADYDWPQFDENTASTLCYTSGTTGNPKGVLYSHRSTVLHAFCATSVDGLALCARDSALLVTPLFHVNAWGVPFAAAMSGCKLVLVGSALDGQSLYELAVAEQCTFSLGVPTVWFGFLDFIEQHVPASDRSALTLKRVLSGGAAVPRALIERFRDVLGVDLIQAWGMTETSPVATVARPLRKHGGLDADARAGLAARQGRPVYGIQLRLEDAEGNPLPHDGRHNGELLVRGPWVISRYFRADHDAVGPDNWFATGDIARIDSDGFLQLTDRSKDVIKSGGEWISSIDLENAAIAHADVAEAAVIGVPHPRWQERPIMLVQRVEGGRVSRDEIIAFLAERVARWWLPDDIVFVESLPHTATGKLYKVALRETYRDHLLDCS